MSRHIIWIDNAKLLAMFLVLFEHHGLENRFVADWIWTFHLAAFIFISGLFANSKSNFGVFLKNNFNRLIIPVVLWHLIGSISWQPALAYVMKPSEVLHSLLQTQMDFFAGRSCGFGWFMICLFWIKCEFWFLHRLNISLLYICGLLLFPLAAFILNVNEIMIPFYIVNSLMSFPFYLFGYALRDRVKTLQLSPLLAWPFFFILVAISLLLCLQFGRYSLNSLEFGYPPAVIYGLLCAFFVFLFSYIIQFEKPVFKILGGGYYRVTSFTTTILTYFKSIISYRSKASTPCSVF